jgi:transcription antitermination factor NusA-like protein
MKAKVCKVCALSNIFCSQCSEKFEKGILNSTEVEIAKYLYEIEEKFKEVKNINLEEVSSINNDNLLVIVSSPSLLNPLLVSSLSKYLSNKTGKNVKIVEKVKDVKKFVSQIFYPVKILSLNQVWSPEGSYEYNIRISKEEIIKLTIGIKEMEKVISKLLSTNVRITID